MVRKIHINLCRENFGTNPKIYIFGPFSEEQLDNENNSFEIYEVSAEVEDFVLYFNGNESFVAADNELEEIFDKTQDAYTILSNFYNKFSEKEFIEFSIEQGYDSYIYVFEDIYSEGKDLSDDELKIKFLNIKKGKK